MIVCGFEGIGKSVVSNTIPAVINLRSTPFNGDWKTYVRVANHMSNKVNLVLLSCHKELRKELQKQKIDYVVILPEKKLKDEYLKRYKNHGDDKEFIKAMRDHWDSYVKPLVGENVVTIGEGQYLYDILEKVKNCPIKAKVKEMTSSSISSFAPEKMTTIITSPFVKPVDEVVTSKGDIKKKYFDEEPFKEDVIEAIDSLVSELE